MTGNVQKLHTDGSTRPLPEPIVRPCEWGLRACIMGMESQLGSIEAYNMLVKYAESLKSKIEIGNGEAQNPYFATDPRRHPKNKR